MFKLLQSSFDAALLEKVTLFAKTTEEKEDGKLEFEFLEAGLAEYWPHNKAEYYQVWRRTGETVGRSPSLGQRDLPAELSLRKSPTFANISLPDGRPGKLVLLNFTPQSADGAPTGEYTMAIAVSRKELSRAQFRVLKGLFITGIALVLCIFPAVWWSVRRALISLQSLGEQANTIKADNLSFRFSIAGSPHELVPICTRLNSLLERLEAAFHREHRFTADAAHELRTPIAELRTLSEVGLEEASGSAPALREYFEDALGIARHLESLVTTLLTLTRCEAGIQKVDLNPADMGEIVRDIWESYALETRDKNITATVEITGCALILTDAGLLQAILENIFSNAVSYTPVGGTIHVSLRQELGFVVFTVQNSSRELCENDLVHLFEPFWRKEAERSDAIHCGVGLSLVAAYAQILGMTLQASMPGDGLFQLVLRCAVSR